MRKLINICILWLVPLLALAAPKVVVTIKPLQAIAQAVMADVAEPKLLLKPGVSPHSYALKPSEMRLLQKADLIIWVGPGLENFLNKTLQQLPPENIMTLLNEHELILYPYDDDTQNAHGDVDPHIWLDPLNMQIFAELLAVRLALLDPENADQYHQNAAVVKAELGKLNATIDEQLTPIRHRHFVVFHDAFQYLERRYELHPAGHLTVNPDIMPSAAQILAIKQTLKNQGISCIFSEPQFSPAIVERIAEETGTRYGTLDPIGGPEGTGFAAYTKLMQELADGLLQCLQVETDDEKSN